MKYTNSHDIAMKLENMLSKEFEKGFSHSGTTFSADIIDNRKGLFYEMMNLLLHVKGASEEDLRFLNSIYEAIKDKSLNEIDDYDELFFEFERLYSNGMRNIENEKSR